MSVDIVHMPKATVTEMAQRLGVTRKTVMLYLADRGIKPVSYRATGAVRTDLYDEELVCTGFISMRKNRLAKNCAYVTFGCSQDFRESIGVAAEKEGIPISELVRFAVQLYLDRKQLEKVNG